MEESNSNEDKTHISLVVIGHVDAGKISSLSLSVFVYN